jgi:hypothetical protein
MLAFFESLAYFWSNSVLSFFQKKTSFEELVNNKNNNIIPPLATILQRKILIH